jgi:two-component system alkaline phosphatase synthesis response regulator PhoP
MSQSVLVIEDDPALSRALSRELGARSVECKVVTCASEVRAVEGTYRVAIVDVNLPDGNGIDLYVELVANSQVGSGVFFTATDDESDKARASQMGILVPKSQGVSAAVASALHVLARTA